jgi:dTMP kinase
MNRTSVVQSVPPRLGELIARLEKKRGLLIAFEGPEGAGKSTQRKLFKAWLKGEGHKVVSSKWNSSALIKPLIRARKNIHALGPLDYSLLHAADYRQRLETEILPALAAGHMVVADRYFFTAVARDIARGLDLDWVLKLYSPILWPDVVFHFSISGDLSLKRVQSDRTPSFYESGQDVTGLSDPAESYAHFMERIIKEYEALALIFEFVTIDAERSVYEQHRQIRMLFQQGRRRSWTEFNAAAVEDWLTVRPEVNFGEV